MADNFVHYLKHAFLNHWNLLALGATTALALISGRADIIVPAGLAAEIVYLAGLASLPRFQAYIDALKQPSAHLSEVVSEVPDEKIQEILSSLSQPDKHRFEALRNLCRELRQIQEKLGSETQKVNLTLSEMQGSGVNRLLWIFLKLLHSKSALEAFFRTTRESDIRADIARTRQRLDEVIALGEAETKNINKRTSLLDTLAASEQRLRNFEKAVENYKFIELELDRLYSRIAGLAEQGVNRQDPNYLTTEVDVVSDYLEQAEKTVKEMDFLPELSSFNKKPPSLLDMKPVQSVPPKLDRQRKKSQLAQ